MKDEYSYGVPMPEYQEDSQQLESKPKWWQFWK